MNARRVKREEARSARRAVHADTGRSLSLARLGGARIADARRQKRERLEVRA